MNVSRHQVERYYFGDPESIGSRILFIKRESRLREYRRLLTGIREFGNVWHGLTGSFQGDLISIISTGVGPSLVGDAVYALHRPNSTCLYSGTCGGLDPDLEIGDYFVADQAVCGDGYTLALGHKPLSTVSGDQETLNSLKLCFSEDRIHSGTSFTTSSVVRESDPDFWHSVSRECRVIEMGASAFYAATSASRKRAAAYFWVTDMPLGGKSFFDRRSRKDLDTQQARYRRAVSLDMEILARL